MAWPTAVDINRMMQNPQIAFRDKRLHGVTIERDAVGQPRARSGAFAAVYKAVFPNQDSLAVRLFSSDLPERRERYKAISEHLSRQSLGFLVPFTYSDDGFRSTDGKRYPLITMEWVRGETLYDWLQKRAGTADARAIGGVSDKWRQTVQELGRAQIAHGDLQHANVMITDAADIKLVDYDGMCVPKLVGLRNEEIGVEPYQHPDRDGNTKLSLAIDNFSSAFIYVGLKALSAEPRLWHDFVVQPAYDKMLFRKEDFVDPGRSQLFSRLRRSPDGDVQRLATRLCELWRVRMDEVPHLDELLFSFEQVKVLLDQREFDGAIEILTRNKKQPTDAPADLQPRIKDAQQRVAKRAELEAAVAAADEARMAALVGSSLLQGYARAADAVAAAADAPAVVEAIRRLETARAGQRWRDLVREWDAALPVLTRPKGSLRKSAAAFEADVGAWRDRNAICDRLLDCLKASEPDAGVLADLWKKLVDQGGHPDSDAHRPAVERALKRDRAWRAFQVAMGSVAEAGDRALLAAWEESLFGGWRTAEAERGRLDQARQRLEAAKAFRAAAGSGLSRGGEEQVIRHGSALPAGYAAEITTRVDQARGRLAAVRAVDAALAADADSELAAAFRQLESLGGALLVDAACRARIEAAVSRESALATLRTIPTSYTAAQAVKWDVKILAAWSDQLLAGSRDAAPWKPTVEEATRRQKLLRALAQAIEKGDTVLGCGIVAEPCLDGYPFDEKTKRWVESARADAGAVRGMLDAFKTDDRVGFVQSFNARLVRGHAGTLRPHWHRLVAWVKSDVLPAERLGLKPPTAQRPLELQPAADRKSTRCTMRWNWPEQRFTEECRVMVCRNRPAAGESPDTIKGWVDFPMTREMYQSAGGFRRHVIDAAWQGAYVVVWAKIDLGAESFWSEPLVLGKV
jgi:hypothetical protein